MVTDGGGGNAAASIILAPEGALVHAATIGGLTPDTEYTYFVTSRLIDVDDLIAQGLLSEEDVKNWCAESLPEYRVPKRVYFIDDLPKNDRGKVRRDDLKAIWQKDHVTA